MSTLNVEHLKHENSSSNNVTMDSDGSVAMSTLNVEHLKHENSISDNITLDSAGHVGIGVTPSAWGGSWKAVELNAGSMSSASNTDLLLAQNAYNDNTNWRYKNTALASAYAMAAGQHRFFTAPSGTAGNEVTFTQAMTLDASGRLTVPNQPAFMSHGTAGGVSYPVGDFVIPYNTATYNMGNHYNTSTYRFTAPVAGVYFLSLSFLQYPTASSDYVTLWISVNGGTYLTSQPMSRRSLASQTTLQCSGLLYLSAGDYVEPRLNGTGAYYTSTGHAHFSGYLVG